MKSNNEKTDHWQHYRPVDNIDRGWGLQVFDAGFNDVRPGSPYPPYPPPAPYYFSWEEGRRLADGYHVVLIENGCGEMETEHGGKMKVCDGDVFLLFPGEWHRYRPYVDTGWLELWCGFAGEYADRFMGAFFSRANPIVKGVRVASVRSRLRKILELFMKDSVADAPSMVVETVGLIAEISPFASKSRSVVSHAINQACDELNVRFRENVDLEDMAGRLGMSYPLFRREFKRQTGFAPHAYVMELRMNRVKRLLAESKSSMAFIAENVGFATQTYLTRVFQKHEGCAPTEWRRKHVVSK